SFIRQTQPPRKPWRPPAPNRPPWSACWPGTWRHRLPGHAARPRRPGLVPAGRAGTRAADVPAAAAPAPAAAPARREARRPAPGRGGGRPRRGARIRAGRGLRGRAGGVQRSVHDEVAADARSRGLITPSLRGRTALLLAAAALIPAVLVAGAVHVT